MARGGIIQGSRTPRRGPSPQHGMVVGPPKVQYPPVGGTAPFAQQAGGAGVWQRDPRKAVVRILDIYLPEVFPIPGAQEFQGYYYNASVAGPSTVTGPLL